jgi:hypothetical protein
MTVPSVPDINTSKYFIYRYMSILIPVYQPVNTRVSGMSEHNF